MSNKEKRSSTPNTRQQWYLLAALCVVTFLGAMIYAIQSPFYPAAAERKNASPSEYGFVLGSFGLTQFILGPIFGSYLHVVGVRNAFHGGIVLAATSTMAFGFLTYIENPILFLILSFTLRITEACGALAMVVAIYTIVATDFPGSVARSFATVETVYGLGFCLGPPVGVALFSLGGFTLPFLVIGFVHFLAGVVTYAILPRPASITGTSPTSEFKFSTENGKKVGFLALLKVPAVAMYACGILSAILSSQFIGSLLEPHLRQFELDAVMFSLMFFLQGLTQFIFSIIWGLICDRISGPEYITLLGTALLTTSAVVIGPFYWLPLEANLAVTGLGLVLLGLGSSAVLVSAFLQGLAEAKKHEFPDDESTSGLVSGIFTSCISLGCFAGPLLGGVLFEEIGFRGAASTLSLLNAAMMLSFWIFIISKKPLASINELQGVTGGKSNTAFEE